MTVWIVRTESGSEYEVNNDTRTVTRHADAVAPSSGTAVAPAATKKKRFGRKSAEAEPDPNPAAATDDGEAKAATDSEAKAEMRWKYSRMDPQYPMVGVILEFIGRDGKWVTTPVTEVIKK